MAYTTIDNPGLFFNTVLYTGNGTTDHAITGVGFQPDWTWLKKRNTADNNILQDVVRGATNYVISDLSAAQATYAEGFKSFDSDGFTLGNANNTNQNTHTFVAWNWLAGGTASSNGDGATTASVSVNTTSGISIASVTGNSTNFGHGLGVAPNLIIYKPTSATGSWGFACDPLGMTSGYLGLNSTAAFASGSGFIDGTSSTLVTVGSNIANATNIYYMFAEKKGFSKFGSYEGNGNSDGTFVYTGFRPAFVITKRADTGGDNWHTLDNKRDIDNPAEQVLQPNDTGAEATTSTSKLDFLSNGFKCRGTGASINTSGLTYIYMAFAEHPFVTAGTKAAGTAR